MPNAVSSVNEKLLQEIQHYGPVTAASLHHDFVLVGYGPILKVFKVEQNSKVRQIYSTRAFKRNKIHGIAVSTNALAVFGCRSFAVFNVDWASGLFPLEIKEKAVNEWIIACEFQGLSQLLMLTSHNEVIRVDISDMDLFHFNVQEKIHCNEKSILYSGSITITTDGQVLVAAGTVMSGVLVWDLNTRQPVHSLTEHQGSIFGVKIDKSGQYLISCSDDRSIKLYDLTSGSVLASGWGHGSRIWSLHFVSIEPSVRIFSTGEDCTARMWEYVPGSDTLDKLDLWDNCHLGKHVWCSDVDAEGLCASVTGGADGKVRLHDLSGEEATTFELGAIAASSGVTFEKKEVVKQFAFLPNLDILVVMTSLGKLLACQDDKWEQIVLSDEHSSLFREFSLLRAFPETNSVVIVSRAGDILILAFEGSVQPTSVTAHESTGEKKKIINALVAFDLAKKEYYLLLDCPNPNVPFEVQVFASNSEGQLSVKNTLTLYKPDPKIFTPTSIHYDFRNHWLLVGSRHSNFAVYKLAGEHYELPLLVRKVCPGDTITSISTVQSGENNLVALLTIRDGLYLYMRISVVGEKFVFEIILQNKISRGFIEGGFVSNNNLHLYGFHSSSFFLWNESKQVEVAHQLCGGSHRQWELVASPNEEFRFIYLNKSGMVVRPIHRRFKMSENGLLVEGTHGREVRGVAISPVQEQDGSRLIATASEDLTIKLGNIFSDGKVKYQWTMNNHVSGLQTVKFLNHEYMASSAANEELLVWKLQRLANNVVTIVEDARLTPTEENPDLRVMDFASIETPDGFWLASVYSNSKIKIWFYDTSKKLFLLVAEDTYSTFCILGVEFLQNEDHIIMATTTTDGFLTLYNVSSTLEVGSVSKLENLIVKQQLHQSGIKSILFIPSGQQWRIVTGGDDNALVLSTLSSDLVLTVDAFVEKAASATITGIANAGENQVMATSVDQIVRLWTFAETELVCKSANYTTVADTGCCDATMINGNKLGVVGGAGIGIWTW